MHKLFKADLLLVLLTVIGLIYLGNNKIIDIQYGLLLFFIYVLSKVVGYFILPYAQFDIFLNELISSSKISYISGFEIFKTVLVFLLYVGFLLIDPSIWIIESILVVMMRVWGYGYIKRNSVNML